MNSPEPVIRATGPLNDVEMAPHAIFGRPIQYFTLDYYEGHDDLDRFKAASFALNNEHHFCLRHYPGYPKQTVTVYLEYDFSEAREVQSVIGAIVQGFHMPAMAVQWKRGDAIDFGSIQPLRGRLHEPEARILALKIALTHPSGRASTSYIKDHIPFFIPLTRQDLVRSSSRGNEPKWRQVAGNVVSHKPQGTSIFSLGYADKIDDDIVVTTSGEAYLSNMGFSAKEISAEDRAALARRDPEFDFE